MEAVLLFFIIYNLINDCTDIFWASFGVLNSQLLFFFKESLDTLFKKKLWVMHLYF